MTHQAHSTATGRYARRLLSVAVVGLVVAGSASMAQMPASSTTLSSAPPLEAYTDPGWTGKPQPVAILRKEAGAALQAGRQRCAREPTAQARRDCMAIVMADYREMQRTIESRRARR